jgi:hypothetical protein
VGHVNLKTHVFGDDNVLDVIVQSPINAFGLDFFIDVITQDALFVLLLPPPPPPPPPAVEADAVSVTVAND